MILLQDKLVEQVSKAAVKTDPAIPKTYAAAMLSPFLKQWREACEAEMRQMEDMKVFEVCYLPAGERVTDIKWVFLLKRDADNRPVKFKARLVAREFSQVKGVNYAKTVAPTATFSALRILMTIVA